MWKKRKSNADGEAPATKYQKKTYGKETNYDDTESILVCEMGSKRVTVRNFNGKVMVDIRDYFLNPAGEKCPTKKGIMLTLDQWNILREHVDEIDKVVADN